MSNEPIPYCGRCRDCHVPEQTCERRAKERELENWRRACEGMPAVTKPEAMEAMLEAEEIIDDPMRGLAAMGTLRRYIEQT